MFRTILCPIDFSAHSRQALRYAALLASRSQGRLIVLYAEDPLLMNAAVAANYQANQLIASMRKELTHVVRRTIAPYPVNTNRLTLQVAVGKPHAIIRATVKSFGCDLVVMGTHGLTGPRRLMFGSTTHRVLRKVEVPVLAVPPVKRGTPAPSRTWPGRWVLAPIDLGARDNQDAFSAALVTDALDSQLLLLHVVEPGDTSVWQRFDLPRRDRDRMMKTRAEARLDALRVRTEAAVVTAARVVAAAANDRQVGLVIMTRRRGQGLFGPRQGSISYQVIAHAATPVLALPSTNGWIRRADSLKRSTRVHGPPPRRSAGMPFQRQGGTL